MSQKNWTIVIALVGLGLTVYLGRKQLAALAALRPAAPIGDTPGLSAYGGGGVDDQGPTPARSSDGITPFAAPLIGNDDFDLSVGASGAALMPDVI